MALGEAFISVHADLKPFKRELDTEMRKILKELDIQLTKAGKESSKGFIDGFLDGIKKNQGTISKSFAKIFSKIKPKVSAEVDEDNLRRSFSRAFDRINRTVGRGFKFFGPLSFLKGQTDIDNFARGISGLFGGMLRGFRKLGEAGTKFADTMGKVGKSLARVVGLIAKTGSLIVTLFKLAFSILGPPGILGAIIQFGAEFRRLIGLAALLPGALAVIAGAIIPIRVAWLGVNEAIEAAVEGDLEKFEEAIKNLTPSARQFARAFKGLLPLFDQLRKAAQEAFFGANGAFGPKGLSAGLEFAVQRLMPLLESGFTRVATAAGKFVGAIFGLADDPNVRDLLENLFPTVARIIDRLRGPVVEALSALAAAANKSLPTIERLADKFGGLIERFATWILEAVSSGEFQAWIDTALETLGKLIITGELVFAVLDALFDRADEGGKDFLTNLNDALTKLETWLRTAEGKKFIDNLIVSAEALATLLVFTAEVIGSISSAIDSVGGALDRLDEHIRRTRDRLRDLLGLRNQTFSSRRKGGELEGFANGGIVTRPQLAMVGEGGGPEAIVPLNNPRRAREVMQQAGLDKMAGSAVYVFIGNEQLDARMMRVVQKSNHGSARALTFQPRTV